jgi:hypothetical protein
VRCCLGHNRTRDRLTYSEKSAPTVAIFGEDWVFGQALELLLAGVDYDARFLGEPRMGGELSELLVGVRLLLLAPAVKEAWREEFLRAVSSSWAIADMPVLELVSAHGEEMSRREGLVPWPCRIEHLKREIETTLASGLDTTIVREDST